jgi:hypothetical protein
MGRQRTSWRLCALPGSLSLPLPPASASHQRFTSGWRCGGRPGTRGHCPRLQREPRRRRRGARPCPLRDLRAIRGSEGSATTGSLPPSTVRTRSTLRHQLPASFLCEVFQRGGISNKEVSMTKVPTFRTWALIIPCSTFNLSSLAHCCFFFLPALALAWGS